MMEIWSNRSETALFIGVESTTQPQLHKAKLGFVMGEAPKVLALYSRDAEADSDWKPLGQFRIVQEIDTDRSKAFKNIYLERCKL
jgi:hypothetical protein